MKFTHVKSNYYQILTFVMLISLTSSNISKNRFLQYIADNELNDTRNTTSEETESSSSYAEDPGTFLLGAFFIFFFMGLYIVCVMKKYKESANRTDDVWKFMFFANNGILVAAGVNIFNTKNLIIGSSDFAITSIIFIIGCIYYINKFCQTCNTEIAFRYFECDKLNELYRIPCFIWSLVGLTDPCCRSESYTVYVYEDGHTESTECCNRIWNCFIYLIKRIATLYTILSYYIFLLFYLCFWLIAKSIFMCILKYKSENEQEQKKEQEIQNDENNNGNNNNQNDVIYYNGPNNGNQGKINQSYSNQSESDRNLNRNKIDNNNNVDNNIYNNYPEDNKSSIDNNSNSRNFNPNYITLSPKQNFGSTENIFIHSEIVKVTKTTKTTKFIKQNPHNLNQNLNINHNNIDNISENERNEVPSESEINKQSPNGDIKINAIKNDNSINNSSENERDGVPSENEINKPSPSGDSQSNEIKNDENEESNNNMDEAPAPELYDEEV